MGIWGSRPKPIPEDIYPGPEFYDLLKYRAEAADLSPVPGADKRKMTIAGARDFHLPDRRPVLYCDDLRALVGGTNVVLEELPQEEDGLSRVLLTVRLHFRKYFFVGKGRSYMDAAGYAYFDAYISLTGQRIEDT
ncbi:Protein of unknown function [Gryllus bimaculatus]|nr:Protein of unknown function [Gryllus bimaculatus]